MQNLFDSMASNFAVTIGAGAFLSGAALLYLVIKRTKEHREKAE